MTTSRIIPVYHHNVDVNDRNGRQKYYSSIISHKPNSISNRGKYGKYTINQKDFGDHKLFYYIPVEYGNNYDLSQLDEMPINERKTQMHLSSLVRRKYYRIYDNNYIEKIPIISPRGHARISPGRASIIRRLHYRLVAPNTSKYVYEHDYRPKNEEITECTVQDHLPRREVGLVFLSKIRLNLSFSST